MAILVTGGMGYIGSHTVVELLNNNLDVVIIDNLANSKIQVKERIEKITNKKLKFYYGNVIDMDILDKIFTDNKIDAVIHFAGLKAVGESTQKPIEYYDNNLSSTLSLVKVMNKHNVKNLVFSSSATVYGEQEEMPIKESAKLNEPTNPYGKTKWFIEYILKDLCKADKEWNVVLLRYFNPIGAHASGLLGEDPNGIPNNLMPFITQVAIGKREKLSVFGSDYNTHDGTGVRDYIHVCDLAHGHLCAINKIKENCGLKIYNLGTGVGYSVLDIVNTFSKVNKINIPYVITDRRPGDIATCYADATLALNEMGFKCVHGLDDMCKDSWNFQKHNPEGIK